MIFGRLNGTQKGFLDANVRAMVKSLDKVPPDSTEVLVSLSGRSIDRHDDIPTKMMKTLQEQHRVGKNEVMFTGVYKISNGEYVCMVIASGFECGFARFSEAGCTEVTMQEAVELRTRSLPLVRSVARQFYEVPEIAASPGQIVSFIKFVGANYDGGPKIFVANTNSEGVAFAEHQAVDSAWNLEDSTSEAADMIRVGALLFVCPVKDSDGSLLGHSVYRDKDNAVTTWTLRIRGDVVVEASDAEATLAIESLIASGDMKAGFLGKVGDVQAARIKAMMKEVRPKVTNKTFSLYMTLMCECTDHPLHVESMAMDGPAAAMSAYSRFREVKGLVGLFGPVVTDDGDMVSFVLITGASIYLRLSRNGELREITANQGRPVIQRAFKKYEEVLKSN